MFEDKRHKRQREYYYEHKGERLAYQRKWRKKHPDYAIKYQRKHHDKVLENQRRRRKENPDYQKKRREGLKRELMDMLGGKCQICGYNKSIHAFDFHHKNPNEKEFKEWSYKRTKRGIENNRIMLVCSNCHRELHHSDVKSFIDNHY